MKRMSAMALLFLALAVGLQAAEQTPVKSKSGAAKPAKGASGAAAASGALPMPGAPGSPAASSAPGEAPGAVDSSPKHIQELIAQFPGEAMGERMRAMNAERQLVKIGKPAVPALIEATKSKDPWTRVWATGALGEIGDPRGKPVLLSLMDDPFYTVRCVAIWHSRQWLKDPEFAKKVAGFLNDPNQEVSDWAFKAMESAKSPQLLAGVKEMLKSSEPVKRAQALGNLKTMMPKAEYIALLKQSVAQDADSAVHKQAFDLLQEMVPDAELTDIMVNEMDKGKDAEIRRELLPKLKQRLSPEACNKLMLGRMEKDDDMKIRIMALQELYKQKEMKNKVIPILIGWFDKLPDQWAEPQKASVLKIAGKMLDMLTAQPFSSNPPPANETPAQAAARWRGWWEKQPKEK